MPAQAELRLTSLTYPLGDKLVKHRGSISGRFDQKLALRSAAAMAGSWCAGRVT